MNENAIEIQAFSKTFGRRPAVDNLTLNVPRGSVLGFLGVNGAGKTTTIRAIMGHLHPSSGTILTLGENPWEMGEASRQRLAYVSENMTLPAWMSPSQVVRFCEAQSPLWDTRLAAKLITDFSLEPDKPYHALSKGQRRRLCLLTALCSGANLIVLDEPASGLDVEARRHLLDRILDVACDGNRTVFFSSHLLTDLERVVDRVAMIDAGRLCLEGDLETLKARVRRLELPGQVSQAILADHFTLLRYELGASRTLAIVSDFSPEKMQALCAQSPIATEPDNFGYDLEDMFLEIRRAKGVTVTEPSSQTLEGDN